MITRIDALPPCDELLRCNNATRRDASTQKSAGAARQINESANVIRSENAPAQQGGWKPKRRDRAPAIGHGGGKVHASVVGWRGTCQRDVVADQRGEQRISRRILRAGLPPRRQRAVVHALAANEPVLLRPVDIVVRCEARSGRSEDDLRPWEGRPEDVVFDRAERAAVIGETPIREPRARVVVKGIAGRAGGENALILVDADVVVDGIASGAADQIRGQAQESLLADGTTVAVRVVIRGVLKLGAVVAIVLAIAVACTWPSVAGPSGEGCGVKLRCLEKSKSEILERVPSAEVPKPHPKELPGRFFPGKIP